MKSLFFIFILATFIITEVSTAGDIKGKVTAKGSKNSGNAVIYIENVEGKNFAPPGTNALVDQKNLSFIPHVLPVVKGTTVDFLNSDDVLHNVFTVDECANKFNLGTWAKGKKKSFTFEQLGCKSILLCNVHPEMEAYVLVLQNPYFAVSDKNGSYVIKNVPAGKYTLKIWHEKLKGYNVAVTVPEKGELIQDFEIRK